MKTKNPAAVALGKMARGIPKNFTPEERRRRQLAMVRLNEEMAIARVARELQRRK